MISVPKNTGILTSEGFVKVSDLTPYHRILVNKNGKSEFKDFSEFCIAYDTPQRYVKFNVNSGLHITLVSTEKIPIGRNIRTAFEGIETKSRTFKIDINDKVYNMQDIDLFYLYITSYLNAIVNEETISIKLLDDIQFSNIYQLEQKYKFTLISEKSLSFKSKLLTKLLKEYKTRLSKMFKTQVTQSKDVLLNQFAVKNYKNAYIMRPRKFYNTVLEYASIMCLNGYSVELDLHEANQYLQAELESGKKIKSYKILRNLNNTSYCTLIAKEPCSVMLLQHIDSKAMSFVIDI